MALIIFICVFVLAAILYVMNLEFEIGTGFSEQKKKAREVPYESSETPESKVGGFIE